MPRSPGFAHSAAGFVFSHILIFFAAVLPVLLSRSRGSSFGGEVKLSMSMPNCSWKPGYSVGDAKTQRPPSASRIASGLCSSRAPRSPGASTGTRRSVMLGPILVIIRRLMQGPLYFEDRVPLVLYARIIIRNPQSSISPTHRSRIHCTSQP